MVYIFSCIFELFTIFRASIDFVINFENSATHMKSKKLKWNVLEIYHTKDIIEIFKNLLKNPCRTF